jgi:EpsI family protein
MPKSNPFLSKRYLILIASCLILALQAGASRMLKIDEQNISIPGLHQIPSTLGKWTSTAEESMGAETEAYLKPDEYILRDYADKQAGTNINVFIAFFKSLQNVYGPHSPRVCLPGAGWLVSSSKIENVTVPGRPSPIPVNEFTMEKGGERILVVYWYQNDRAAWAQEFQAKLRLLPDLLRYRRSDVSLVRLITPLRNPTPDAELASCLEFTKRLFPLVSEHLASVSTQRQ